ncbi:MAG: hypothetical protein IIY91_10795, partial [Selenomonas sp.]|nr:hypothetical protein [Selenomonas sp.]
MADGRESFLHVPLCHQTKNNFCLLLQHEKLKLALLKQLAFHAAFCVGKNYFLNACRQTLPLAKNSPCRQKL